MWDFKTTSIIQAMAKTAPFILFRMFVYLSIATIYILITATTTWMGFTLDKILNSGELPYTFWGFIIGLGSGGGILYWAREYILYIVKAGHIAVLVEHLQGNELPSGRGQIEHATHVVKSQFKETSLLFGLDQLIKGILKAVNKALMTAANFLPIPGLESLVDFLGKIVRVSLTYVDEIILAYNIRNKVENPWQGSKEAIILYAQNFKVMIKNAVFIMLLMYLVTAIIFFALLAPVSALAVIIPGSAGLVSIVCAFIFALCLKAALLEPIAVAAMMQVYFKTIEGQQPNPDWEEKLTAASDKFRELKDKATAQPPKAVQKSVELEKQPA